MASVYAITEPTPQLRAQIAALEQGLYRAQVAGSVKDIEPLLSADLRYLHSTGVAETRSQYLSGVADRLYEYGRIESRDVRLNLSEDLAIQDGLVDMTVSAHGARKTLIYLLFCLVWRREGAQWRLLYRQATRIP
ncbi:MAG TPA: nuclear transport factor 2 family protein [Casimicrobiaceae bacterium]